jgi:hypothetical protein
MAKTKKIKNKNKNTQKTKVNVNVVIHKPIRQRKEKKKQVEASGRGIPQRMQTQEIPNPPNELMRMAMYSNLFRAPQPTPMPFPWFKENSQPPVQVVPSASTSNPVIVNVPKATYKVSDATQNFLEEMEQRREQQIQALQQASLEQDERFQNLFKTQAEQLHERLHQGISSLGEDLAQRQLQSELQQEQLLDNQRKQMEDLQVASGAALEALRATQKALEQQGEDLRTIAEQQDPRFASLETFFTQQTKYNKDFEMQLGETQKSFREENEKAMAQALKVESQLDTEKEALEKQLDFHNKQLSNLVEEQEAFRNALQSQGQSQSFVKEDFERKIKDIDGRIEESQQLIQNDQEKIKEKLVDVEQNIGRIPETIHSIVNRRTDRLKEELEFERLQRQTPMSAHSRRIEATSPKVLFSPSELRRTESSSSLQEGSATPVSAKSTPQTESEEEPESPEEEQESPVPPTPAEEANRNEWRNFYEKAVFAKLSIEKIADYENEFREGYDPKTWPNYIINQRTMRENSTRPKSDYYNELYSFIKSKEGF